MTEGVRDPSEDWTLEEARAMWDTGERVEILTVVGASGPSNLSDGVVVTLEAAEPASMEPKFTYEFV